MLRKQTVEILQELAKDHNLDFKTRGGWIYTPQASLYLVTEGGHIIRPKGCLEREIDLATIENLNKKEVRIVSHHFAREFEFFPEGETAHLAERLRRGACYGETRVPNYNEVNEEPISANVVKALYDTLTVKVHEAFQARGYKVNNMLLLK